ncbi:NYN domain-containing protein [Pseudooceanicola sp. HF7]|uniref:LabA-like NYN domain-containing protein n=1 Tax=Pseudooceanicola sp. HF7 TaxID=2721560 RepID=UPI00142F5915|nr:NYN domain-containing protein [Pseudooceanicola sp. HF7]NIZ09285.1 NYN domain-containing protein [Pseudooceanicola sp. HF7]
MFHPNDTAAAFIDGPNFHATARALGFDVDYRKLLALLTSEARLLRASYFTPIAESDEHVAIRPLVDWMQYNGWHVTTKACREHTTDDGRRRFRGSTDIDLAVAATDLAPFITHAAIFTGNRDFAPLVHALQAKGVRVTIVSTIQTASPFAADDLRRMADAFVDVEDLRHVIARPERQAA